MRNDRHKQVVSRLKQEGFKLIKESQEGRFDIYQKDGYPPVFIDWVLKERGERELVNRIAGISKWWR